MKVVCIDDEFPNEKGELMTGPKMDEICDVIDIVTVGNDTGYLLKKYPPYFAYYINQFIPLDQYLDQFTGVLTKELEKQQFITI